MTTVRPLGNNNSGFSGNHNYGNYSGLVNSIFNGLNNSQPTYKKRERTVHRPAPVQPQSRGETAVDRYFKQHGLSAFDGN